jgi:CubicO group peptidase (beta-lactamase class C family)
MRDSRLDEIARELVVVAGVAPAATVASARRLGNQYLIATGAAGAVNGTALDPDALFDLASVSKPFLAVTAARLARHGQLSFDAPLESLVAETRGTACGPLSIELLLSHRAGLEAHLPLFSVLLAELPLDRAHAIRRVASARRRECALPMPAAG